MKNIILLTLIFTFTAQLNAQNYDLPPNPKAGKCYERCFEYETKFEWKEVDCEKIKKKTTKEKTKEELIKTEQNKLKMKKYQEKLKKLGHEVDINGVADNKTIIAHHKYLKKRKRKKERDEKLKKEKPNLTKITFLNNTPNTNYHLKLSNIYKSAKSLKLAY